MPTGSRTHDKRPFNTRRPHSGVGVVLSPEENALLKEEYKLRFVENRRRKTMTLKQLKMGSWLFNKWLEEDEEFAEWVADEEATLFDDLQHTNVRVALDETRPDSFRSRALELKMRSRRYREAEQPRILPGGIPQKIEISFVPRELPEQIVEGEVKELPPGED